MPPKRISASAKKRESRKRPHKQERHYAREINLHFSPGWFIAGAVLTIFMVLLAGNLLKLGNRKKTDKNLIAPYYTVESFKRPASEPTRPAEMKSFNLPIVMYHYVDYVPENDLVKLKLDTSPYTFERHLAALKEAGYESYFVKDIPHILKGEMYYNPKSIVLTFDDGYEDFYKVVFPLLKKYHMRGTVYVINNYVGRTGFLTEAEIKELGRSSLVEIGSHTLDHAYLKNMGKADARREIFESKTRLEKLIGSPVVTFAYPYGAYDDQAEQLVKEASFSAAVSVVPGVMQADDNLFRLLRIRPGILTPYNMIQTLKNFNK